MGSGLVLCRSMPHLATISLRCDLVSPTGLKRFGARSEFDLEFFEFLKSKCIRIKSDYRIWANTRRVASYTNPHKWYFEN